MAGSGGSVKTAVPTFPYKPTDLMAILVNDTGVRLSKNDEYQALFKLRMKSFYRQSNDIQVPTTVKVEVKVTLLKSN